jgi:hypothetical protein
MCANYNHQDTDRHLLEGLEHEDTLGASKSECGQSYWKSQPFHSESTTHLPRSRNSALSYKLSRDKAYVHKMTSGKMCIAIYSQLDSRKYANICQ